MAPLLIPLLAFAAGILSSSYLDSHSLWTAFPLAVLIACARPRLALLALFLLGAGLRGLTPPVPPDPGPVAVRLAGTLERRPEWRGPGVYMNVRVDSFDDRPSYGRVRLTEFLEEPELVEIFKALDLGSGDRVEILVKLVRPGVFRDPGVFDYRQYLERQGVYWTGTIRNPRLITVLGRGWHGSDRMHGWIERRLDRHFVADRAVGGLVAGLVLGRKSAVTVDVERQFKAAGVYHLVVVSGFHFAIVMAAAAWLSRFLTKRRLGRFVLPMAAGLAYAAIAEGEAPALRALIMAAFVVAGQTLDRGHASMNAVAASALVLLLWDPSSLEDASFQMTFAAVATVIVLGGPAARWIFERPNTALQGFDDVDRDGQLAIEVADWRVSRRLWLELHRLPSWALTVPWRIALFCGEALVIAAAVESVFIYFMVESFHRLSPVSPFLNVPAGAIAAIVTCGGLVMIALPDMLAAPLAWILTKLLHVLIWTLDAGVAFPFATFRVPSPPPWMWMVYGTAVAVLVVAVGRRWRWLAGVVAAALVAFHALFACADFSPDPPKDLTLTALDVGQGDSILVEFPDGRRMLVDGGGVSAGRFLGLREESGFSIGEDVVSAYLFARGIRRLDTIVLTHAHNDHLDGLFDVIENFKVGEAWLGPNPAIPRFRDFLVQLSRRSIPIRWVAAGQTFAGIEVLHPPRTWKIRKSAQNNDSVVLLIRSGAGAQTALLTGDLEIPLPGAPPHVSVLKVPHHGSGGARLKIPADLRVISVGANNPFGHPAPSALPALRTDRLGAITVVLSGAHPHVAP